jgi:hypothetical protein
MNQIFINILAAVVTCIILPLISFLGVKLTEWLNTKIKNEKGQALIKKATDIVLNAVRCVFQSYVEALKKSGGFDQKAQIYAFNLAKDIALKQLGDDAKKYIAQNYGDLEEWLKTEIESSINLLKN